VSLWGLVRPAHGRTTVTVLVNGSRYKRIRTDSRGYFLRRVPYVRGRTYALSWNGRRSPGMRVYRQP
jgi:hypothetical protein